MKQGTVINCPVTAADLHHSLTLYDPDIASVRRKTRRKTPSAQETDDIVQLKNDVHLSVDITSIIYLSLSGW